MKNTKKSFAKFSTENLNNIKNLDKNQMIALWGGQTTCTKKTIVPVPDVAW